MAQMPRVGAGVSGHGASLTLSASSSLSSGAQWCPLAAPLRSIFWRHRPYLTPSFTPSARHDRCSPLCNRSSVQLRRKPSPMLSKHSTENGLQSDEIVPWAWRHASNNEPSRKAGLRNLPAFFFSLRLNLSTLRPSPRVASGGISSFPCR